MALTGISATASGFWDRVFGDRANLAPEGTAIAVPVTSMQTGTVLMTAPKQLIDLEPSYTYGRPTQGTWAPVNPDEPAKVGDTLRITYRMSVPFYQKWQAERLTSQWAQDDRFQLLAVRVNEEKARLVVEARILKPFSPIVIVIVALAAVAVGVTIFLSLEKVERLTEVVTPLGKFSLGGLVAVGIVGLLLLRARR